MIDPCSPKKTYNQFLSYDNNNNESDIKNEYNFP